MSLTQSYSEAQGIEVDWFGLVDKLTRDLAMACRAPRNAVSYCTIGNGQKNIVNVSVL